MTKPFIYKYGELSKDSKINACDLYKKLYLNEYKKLFTISGITLEDFLTHSSYRFSENGNIIYTLKQG